MKFSVFQVSRKGGREKNEDRMGYCYTQSSGLFLVADGMGGHPQGEVAAQIALQVLASRYQKEAIPVLPDVKTFLFEAITAAHRQILRYAFDSKLPDTPRTTLVVAVVQEGVAHWAHCGDSRLYLVREGELLARTRDHSYMESRRTASVPSMNSTTPINRNVLYTCLGSPVSPVIDTAGPVRLQQGDRIMLCSDGLWSNLEDVEIVYHLAQKSVSEAAPALVDQALLKGGPTSDNVTLVAMEWETPNSFETSRSSARSVAPEDSSFASTVQAGLQDPESEALDDDAIERSIAEIRDAIRRSSVRNV